MDEQWLYAKLFLGDSLLLREHLVTLWKNLNCATCVQHLVLSLLGNSSGSPESFFTMTDTASTLLRSAPIYLSVSLFILSPLAIRTLSYLNSSNWTLRRPGASNKAALNWPLWLRVFVWCQFWASFPLQVLILWRRLFKSCEDRVCLTCAQPQQASEPAGACWELLFHIFYDMKLFQVFFTAKNEIKADNQPLLNGTTARYASSALWLHCKRKPACNL